MSDEINLDLDATVVKKGDTCIFTTLRRSASGLSVHVKAHTAVEVFMRGLGTPDAPPVEVGLADRYWAAGKDKPPLMAYRIDTTLPSVLGPNGSPLFTLNALGRPLLDDRDNEGIRQSDLPLNLSFLRLIGISEGQGVMFHLKGVYSLDNLRQFQERLQHAQQQFYIHYIRPVNVSVIVSTQEVQF